MSDNSHATEHDEAHTGPIKTPKQLILAVLYAFVVPIIVMLIYLSIAKRMGAFDAL